MRYRGTFFRKRLLTPFRLRSLGIRQRLNNANRELAFPETARNELRPERQLAQVRVLDFPKTLKSTLLAKIPRSSLCQ